MSSILKTYKSSYYKMVAFFCLCRLLSAGNCFSQAIPPYIDSLNTRIEMYGIKQQTPAMFVHFDKTVYSNNENIWFTAYLINAKKENDHTVLLMNLVKDDSRKIVLEDKFILQNGLAFGNMFIPDSISAGNYTLVAYTNVLKQGRPWVIFKQPISIKTAGEETFTAHLSPIDTEITSAERKIRLLANISVLQPLANAQVSYYVGSPANHLLSGVVKTSLTGEYIFTVPSKLLTEGNNKLYASIKYNKEEKEVSMVLPVAKQPDVVNFYPEGGNLVNNLQTHVGWETKAANGVPIKATAILYRDDKPVDTIETNGYGMGKFLITPHAGTRYYVKLFNNEKQYELPAILSMGPSLTTQHALANDTLSVVLFDNRPEKLFLLVHNYKELFAAMPITMNGANKRVKVLLRDVPKGITQLTVTDSLGRPFLQRTFFAHYNQRTSLQINTGLPEYHTRQKVSIKIKLGAQADTAAMALVSIACVQDNRVEAKKMNDIESFFYLKNEIGDLPVKDNYLGNEEADKNFLENVLLIKGWSKYKWTDVLRVKATDTVRQFISPVFSGLVSTVNNRNLKKPVQVMLMNGARVIPVQTDSVGNIVFENNALVTEPEKKIFALVAGETPGNYKVQLNDPYSVTDQKILDWLTYKDYSTTAQQSTANSQLDGFQRSIQLNEVKIIDKKDDQFYGSVSLFGSNACGDYVCRYNILNCPNHRNDIGNRPPVPGMQYNSNGGKVVYQGCTTNQKNDFAAKFKGIYSALEFYPADYSQASPSQPDYVSTIYWNHLSQIKSVGETELLFYTSDITGRFKIIVQGLTNNGVVYGEKTFNVVKAK